MRRKVPSFDLRLREEKTNLMILKTQILQEAIVPDHVGLHFLDVWLVLEVQVSLKESAVKLDNLAEGKVLAGRLV